VIISGLWRKSPRLKWFRSIMVPTLFLATAVGFKLFAAAPDHIWSNGTVLDVDTIRRILAREEGSTARTVRHGLLYAVQSDTSIYLTEEVANGQRAARLKGNVEVMFRLEGDTLFILYWFSVKLRREEAAEGGNSALRAGIFKAWGSIVPI